MSQEELDAHRNALVALFNERDIDRTQAVTVMLMAAAELYGQLIREEDFAPEGFLSTASVAFDAVVRGVRRS